eukprot:TRINITY_DN9171_c0_g1_i1.p1 TRINITY_DN9171_c0_g1~~TRINITY_DN9171_c0_g1_i1.p1  ORF type:complete len:365 (+),score=98.40 TRINITY_DN9171_c0_g1_i1:56-1096(+)
MAGERRRDRRRRRSSEDSSESRSDAGAGPQSLRRYAGYGAGTVGVVRRWEQDKGFGFIECPSGRDVFVARANLPDSGRGWSVTVGQELVFDVEKASDGRQRAVRVQGPALFRTNDQMVRGAVVQPGSAANNPTGHRPRPVNIWAGSKEHDDRIHRAMERQRNRERTERDRKLRASDAVAAPRASGGDLVGRGAADRRRVIQAADSEREELRKALLRRQAGGAAAEQPSQSNVVTIRKPPRGFLGASLRDTVVTAVHPGTAAEQAGLSPGMRLCTIDGKPVTDKSDILAALRAAGRDIEVVIDHVAAFTAPRKRRRRMPRRPEWRPSSSGSGSRALSRRPQRVRPRS